jgi:hypothetical protein
MSFLLHAGITTDAQTVGRVEEWKCFDVCDRFLTSLIDIYNTNYEAQLTMKGSISSYLTDDELQKLMG